MFEEVPRVRRGFLRRPFIIGPFVIGRLPVAFAGSATGIIVELDSIAEPATSWFRRPA